MPMWIGPRSRGGVYWHVPRAALDFGDRLAISMWCGVHFNGVTGDLPLVEPPAGVKCGTCLGRFHGAQGIDGLIFSPRDDFAAPKVCPGADVVDGCCAACGVPVRTWLGGPQRHAPGPGFAARFAPCPDHGWRWARVRADGRIVCRCFVGCGWDYCDFVCGPNDARAAA